MDTLVIPIGADVGRECTCCTYTHITTYAGVYGYEQVLPTPVCIINLCWYIL